MEIKIIHKGGNYDFVQESDHSNEDEEWEEIKKTEKEKMEMRKKFNEINANNMQKNYNQRIIEGKKKNDKIGLAIVGIIVALILLYTSGADPLKMIQLNPTLLNSTTGQVTLPNIPQENKLSAEEQSKINELTGEFKQYYQNFGVFLDNANTQLSYFSNDAISLKEKRLKCSSKEIKNFEKESQAYEKLYSTYKKAFEENKELLSKANIQFISYINSEKLIETCQKLKQTPIYQILKNDETKGLSGTVITFPTSTYEPSANIDLSISKIEQIIFERTNQLRSTSLNWSNGLVDLARNHSQDMIIRHFFEHTNPDGDGPTERAKKAGIDTEIQRGGYTYIGIGENISETPTGDVIGCGNVYTEEQIANCAMEGWINSPGHHANLVNTDYTEIGVGVASDGSTYYLTQDFR